MSGPRGEDGGTLRIGAVARLAGVSPHTLRKWETRYGAVAPRRTEGGERVYTHADVERLRLIKRLADVGLSLRALAGMSLDALAGAWEQVGGEAPLAQAEALGPVRVAILGGALAAAADRPGAGPARMEIIASADTPQALAAALGGADFDVLMLECPTVDRDTRRAVRELREKLAARAAVVVYRFGARADVLAVQTPGVVAVRAPADRAALEQAALGLRLSRAQAPDAAPRLLYGGDAEVPPPRISRAAIARVARLSPRLLCECPHHLADILLGLRAFEQYSAECESRNAEDAALHRSLWRSAAQARALFEQALERVAEAEGIELGD